MLYLLHCIPCFCTHAYLSPTWNDIHHMLIDAVIQCKEEILHPKNNKKTKTKVCIYRERCIYIYIYTQYIKIYIKYIHTKYIKIYVRRGATGPGRASMARRLLFVVISFCIYCVTFLYMSYIFCIFCILFVLYLVCNISSLHCISSR